MTATQDLTGLTLDCECATTEIRRRTKRNGVRVYARQCLTCGRSMGEVGKGHPDVMRLVTINNFDEGLQEQWHARRQEVWKARQAAYEADKQVQDAAWWARYNAYLLTPAWAARRRLVMKRAGNWCEGCGQQPASEVHHLTYAHVTEEFLFELVALCLACHRRVHEGRNESYPR